DAGILLATPEGGCRGRGLVPLLPPRQVALLPLAADAARQRAMLDGKWRNRLARGEGLGGLRLACRRPGPADLDWLSRREAGQRRQKGYRGLPASFNRAWCAVDPDGARLYLASAGEEPVAAALILVHPPWASYHIAWSDAPGRAHQAPRLILWQAMRDLAAAGITMLDLGLADPEGAPGLARFKLGTGARLHRLGPTLLVLPELTRRRSRSPAASRPDPRPTGGT
ncbi:GNAT family N-acetyltransferase, partial [Albidovulum sp.]